MPTAIAIGEPQRHEQYIEGEQLGDQITELCGYIYAATYRLLVLIREFDDAGYWQLPGLCSCAHWLNFKCGIGMNAAREKVRVAHALAELPKISSAFEKGELNYFYDDDGSLVINGRLPAEQGALVVKALEKAMDRQFHADEVTAETSNIEDGPHVSAETSRRIACDCSLIKVTDNEEGEPLSIGRKTRTIPPAIRRALRFRDKGCRFPGCTNTHFVDGHHLQHWADGGETSVDNLVQLCRQHHRLVHEGGFACERTADGKIEFRSPVGVELQEYHPLSRVPCGGDIQQWIQFNDPNAEIDEQTCVPMWRAGESMDWDLAVGALFESRA